LPFPQRREPKWGDRVLLAERTNTQPKTPALGQGSGRLQKEIIMLGWALTFLVIALIAAVLGFGGIAGASAGIAQILFFVFLALFVISLIARAVRGRPPL
jgi:uncharacterized membrane protein YtjA (UPF0391 family)